MRKLILLLVVLLGLSACAFAPLQTTNTARSLGQNKWGMDAGLSPAAYITGAYGVTKDLDMGIVFEDQFAPLLGIWGQYSLINNKDNGALALHGGVAKGTGVMESTSFFMGPVVSLKKSWFETYLNVRYNYVDFKGSSLSSDDMSDLFFDNLPGFNISYIQSTFGFNFWFSEKVGLNINAKHFTILSEGATVEDNIIPAIGMNFRF